MLNNLVALIDLFNVLEQGLGFRQYVPIKGSVAGQPMDGRAPFTGFAQEIRV
jgi:hypothetical protein